MQKGIATCETFLISDIKHYVNSEQKIIFKRLDQ